MLYTFRFSTQLMHQITVTDSQSKYLINIKKVYLNTFYQLLLM